MRLVREGSLLSVDSQKRGSGTGGRTRTVKLLRAGDFESPVSTNSTTPAQIKRAKYNKARANGNNLLRRLRYYVILLRESDG